MASPVWTLIVFISTILGILFCVSFSPKVTLPCLNKQISITYLYPPVFGCLILLISFQMSPREMWLNGVIGDSHIQPYTIILLVISIAIVCISLDYTGALSFIAFKTVAYFATTKLRLIALIFGLSAIFSLLTSNDVVVMTMTPIVIYCCSFAQLDATPYLYAAFYAANLSALLFIVSNPTNIIVGQAFGITFFDFTKFMVIPAIVCAFMGFMSILVMFRRQLGLEIADIILITFFKKKLFDKNDVKSINNRYDDMNVLDKTPPSSLQSDDPNVVAVDLDVLPQTDPHAITLPYLDIDGTLKDRRGAYFHSALLLLCLILMAVSSFIYEGIQIYMVSCAAGALSLIYDLIFYPFFPTDSPQSTSSSDQQTFHPSSTNTDDLSVKPNANPMPSTSPQIYSSYLTQTPKHDHHHDHPDIYDTTQTTILTPYKRQSRSEQQQLQMASQHNFQPLNSPLPPPNPPPVVDPWEVSLETVDDITILHTPYGQYNHINNDQSNPQFSANHNEDSFGDYPITTMAPTPQAQSINFFPDRTQSFYVKKKASIGHSYSFSRRTDDEPTATAKYVESSENSSPDHDSLDDEQLVKQSNNVLSSRELCTFNIIKALPFDAPIFVCTMFILVQSLYQTGWVDSFASLVLNLCGGVEFYAIDSMNIAMDSTRSTIFSSVILLTLVFGLVELFCCQILNNQPATILLTRVLLQCNVLVLQFQKDNYPDLTIPPPGLHHTYLNVMIYSVIAASNYAAILTLVAALAGILFAGIVNSKFLVMMAQTDDIGIIAGYKKQLITYTSFGKVGIWVIGGIYVTVSFAIIIASLYN